MDEFLLNSSTAKELYVHIKDLPIIDYHNHLSPKEIYENKPFTNISSLWLEHDHYKWRLMRFSGHQINGTNEELFEKYAKTIDSAYFNPLYDWTKMELKRFFNIDQELDSNNYKEIYETANAYLKKNISGPRELLKDMNVESLCTTDDIMSNLKYHKLLKEEGFETRVLPTFRPDRLFTMCNVGFIELVNQLDENINSIQDLEKQLRLRLDFFESVGCKLADHGITKPEFVESTQEQADAVFQRRRNNNCIEQDMVLLNSYLLRFFMVEYKKRNWTVQFHLGALRNTNTKEFERVGTDSGYDSISGYNYTNQFTAFLNDVNLVSELPRTIIYPLNATHYEEIAVMCGSFSNGHPGLVQLGAAWWFQDHKEGIERHLKVVGQYLNIRHFMGMLTDSRSFLSFVRHDYFRRILANFFASQIEQGIINTDLTKVKKVIEDIAYYNSKNYLDL